MALAESLNLGPDEFAFHFETQNGVDADILANFLKRAATVARQRGGELRVVGLREGSLAVVIEVFKKGAIKEFKDKPISTSIKTSVFVAAIVGGIIHLMTPAASGSTPLAKAGADLIETHQVTQITIVTNESSTVVMDEATAAEVRRAERDRPQVLHRPEQLMRLSPPVAGLLRDASQGVLTGETDLVRGKLHFRPDRYQYWVPIDENPVMLNHTIHPGGRYRVVGHVALLDGQPDRIVVDHAEVIGDEGSMHLHE